ncbi:DUF4178 domain-containing protein [Pleomorphomonas oryzae]|uniref:DUF4178 domain-containing protein n=1 Tax=Pleomorphomonas oryzae TaxID=261934 RepID=UPI00047CF409|nr:DUF4178 domain-containing protein [Pleomorphomonas oryzae]
MEAIGKVAQLVEDLSPFQIGTTGRIDGAGFMICGRAKMGWQGGEWNEWYLLFDDGSDGWLAEAQGFYAINIATEVPMQYVAPTSDVKLAGRLDLTLNVGQIVSLSNCQLTVVDVKRVACIGTEGELPRVSDMLTYILSADLIGRDGTYGCIEIHDRHPYAFIGRYVEWEELNAVNFRQFEGWS